MRENWSHITRMNIGCLSMSTANKTTSVKGDSDEQQDQQA